MVIVAKIGRVAWDRIDAGQAGGATAVATMDARKREHNGPTKAQIRDWAGRDLGREAYQDGSVDVQLRISPGPLLGNKGSATVQQYSKRIAGRMHVQPSGW